MRDYELTYLITPDLSEEEAKVFQNKIASFIKEEAGLLINEGQISKRRLSYSIKKNTQAYLAVLNFQLDAEKLANLEKKLKLEDQILRYLLLIKVKPKKIRIVPRRKIMSETELEKPFAEPEEKKVELKEIEKKLEEILNESSQ